MNSVLLVLLVLMTVTVATDNFLKEINPEGTFLNLLFWFYRNKQQENSSMMRCEREDLVNRYDIGRKSSRIKKKI